MSNSSNNENTAGGGFWGSVLERLAPEMRLTLGGVLFVYGVCFIWPPLKSMIRILFNRCRYIKKDESGNDTCVPREWDNDGAQQKFLDENKWERKNIVPHDIVPLFIKVTVVSVLAIGYVGLVGSSDRSR